MIKVITVEREYGSQGAEFAAHLAHHLGWKLVDHCLIDQVAAMAGVTPEQVADYDERTDPWYQRVGRAFMQGDMQPAPGGVPANAMFDSEMMNALVQKTIRAEAEAGHCVIVGRGASSILNGVPGVFHIFVYASLPRKIRWFTEHFPEKAKHAEQEILATDRRRSEYVRRYHHHDWADRHLYHLLLNSCMGNEALVGATLEATGLTHAVTLEEQSAE